MSEKAPPWPSPPGAARTTRFLVAIVIELASEPNAVRDWLWPLIVAESVLKASVPWDGPSTIHSTELRAALVEFWVVV